MKLSDFLLGIPDQESIDSSQEIQDLEVKVLVQFYQRKNELVDVKEVETDWNTNTIKILTDVIDS